MKRMLLAEWVAPMSRPMIRKGALAFEHGRIIEAGAAQAVRANHPDAQVEDLGDVLLMPGLVNAHTHLELSDCECGPADADFVNWLKSVIRARIMDESSLETTVRRAVRIGVEQCLRFGVTSVGDISRQCAVTRAELKRGPLRAVSYGEVQGMGKRRSLLEERIAAAIDPTHAGERLYIGITPHAPYSVELEGYRRCLEAARAHGLPLATHLAETPHEEQFLREHAGPLRELWEWLGWWDELVPRFEGGPIRMARSLGLLDYPALLAHVNYCDDKEMEMLAKGRASVVYSPRTHKHFGHPPHRWREMIARGINVTVGTDSCASSPDLNLVDELRLMQDIAPETPAEQLWRMATVNGAAAIGLAGEVGVIEPGARADLIAFDSRGSDPLRSILEERTLPARIWIDGDEIPPKKDVRAKAVDQ